MITFVEISTKDPSYPFVEELLHAAFPSTERRDDVEQRHNTDHQPLFHCLYITDTPHQTPIGLLTYWELSRCNYIEHLAISPALRGQGFGHLVLKEFLASTSRPMILEVEHPTDEQSRRRIAFYKSCGLVFWPCSYLQPPYRPTDNWLPLYLMATPHLNFEQDYLFIQNDIHQTVYGCHRQSSPIS